MPAPLMLMPLVSAARTEPNVAPQSIVIDLVIVTAPKPPGSMQLISPLGAVFEIAPAKVLHGAVRLHGLASSPTPETQVRVAWARAGAALQHEDEQCCSKNERQQNPRHGVLRSEHVIAGGACAPRNGMDCVG